MREYILHTPQPPPFLIFPFQMCLTNLICLQLVQIALPKNCISIVYLQELTHLMSFEVPMSNVSFLWVGIFKFFSFFANFIRNFFDKMFPYSEVPNRRACSLRFFRFSFHPNRTFSCKKQTIPPCSFIISLIEKAGRVIFFPYLLVYSGLLFYLGLQSMRLNF